MTRILASMLEHGRALEWGASIGLLSLAFTMALPGETLDLPSFGTFRQLGIDDATAGVLFGFVATARLVALYINGNWQRSPMLRMIGAMFGASLFSMLAVGFAWPYVIGQSALSIGPGIYATLALCDALSIWRSGGDVRMAGRVS